MNNSPPNASFPLTLPLLKFGSVPFTLADAVVHVLVIGASGTGKTSSVLRRFICAYLKKGFGGLVICTKADDLAMFARWLEETGRSVDARIFAVGQRRFDILKYLLTHPDPAVHNKTNIIETFEKMMTPLLGTPGKGSGGEDGEFWKIQRRILLTHLLSLAMHSGEPVTFDLLAAILKGAPEDPDAAICAETWEQTALGRCLRKAELQTTGTREAKEVRKAREYFLNEYPAFPDKTRGCVVMTVQGMFSCFQDPMVEDLTSALDFTPEEALEGRVLIVDLPDNLVGRMLALGIKHLFQKAALRRSAGPEDASLIPAFFCIDEFQEWITPEDAGFLAKARSSRVACLSLTQNTPGIVAAIGGPTPRESVDALCGNFSTKIFLNSTDPSTTEWMANMIGKALKFSISTQSNARTTFLGNPSFNISQQRELEIHPEEFLRLRTGGPHHHFEVDAIVLLGAKAVPAWGKPWCKIIFTQHGVTPEVSPDYDESLRGTVFWRRWVPAWSSTDSLGRWVRKIWPRPF